VEKKAPLGVLILAGINVLLFGIIPFIFFVSAFFNSPFPIEKISETLKKNEPLFSNINPHQLKTLFLFQALIAFTFLISGIGLFLRKEWARKLTVYFAFLLLILTALSTLATPALIKQIILNAIYPAILVFYFTNKNIGEYFKD
jgi:cytochrome b subunit of formate dehydrogenase